MAPINHQGGNTVLVTGATGFVGRALCVRLAGLGYAVRGAVRNSSAVAGSSAIETFGIGDIGAHANWSEALRGIAVICHLAARTHVLRETSADALRDYRRINVEGTKTLAQAAVGSDVRRIVFLSSVKVTGERTEGHPFTDDSKPQPEDPYGISKWEAEQALCNVLRGTRVEAVILRPPLVYGPGVKGNFLRLMHWIAMGVPLPLASIQNLRSLVYVENLVDAIIAAGFAPAASHKPYLVGDTKDISTPQLIRSIAAAMQRKPHLFPCPPSWLKAGAIVLGKREEMRRLTGSLQMDSSRIRNELHWNPRFQLAQGLAETARWYYSQFPSKSNT